MNRQRMNRQRALGGVALLLALTAAGLAAPALAAQPTPSPSASAPPEAPLKVVVTQLLPRAPRAHEPLEVTGYLTNLGSAPITNPVSSELMAPCAFRRGHRIPRTKQAAMGGLMYPCTLCR